MKKILLTAALLSAATLANASILVGFSFSNITSGNTTVIGDISDITGDTTADNGGWIGTSNGTIYLNTTAGSSDFNMGAASSAFRAATSNSSNVPQNTILTQRQGSPSIDQSGTSSSLAFQYFGSPSLGDANGKSFVIAVNALEAGQYYSDIVLTYAAANQTALASTSLIWSISFDGVTYGQYQEDTITATLANGGTGEVMTDSFTGSGNSFWLMGTISDLDAANPLLIDNLIITGNVVPEPSTYAGIAGGLALAFVALRRRLRK
jgi:hypothetical protein